MQEQTQQGERKNYSFIRSEVVVNFLTNYISELGSETPYVMPAAEYSRLTKEINTKFGTAYSEDTVKGQVRQMKRFLQVPSFRKCSNAVVDGKLVLNYTPPKKMSSKKGGYEISTLQKAVQDFSSILERNQQLELENKQLKDKIITLSDMLRALKDIRDAVNKYNSIHCPHGVHK